MMDFEWAHQKKWPQDLFGEIILKVMAIGLKKTKHLSHHSLLEQVSFCVKQNSSNISGAQVILAFCIHHTKVGVMR